MGSKLTSTGLNIDSNAYSSTEPIISNLPTKVLNVSGVGHSALSSMDVDCYNVFGTLAVGYARPTTNSVYPRFTPIAADGSIVPYSAAIQYNYSTSYGDGGFTNETGYYNFGLPMYNTGKTNNIKFTVEGGGFGWTTFDTTPCIIVRSVYPYANYAVHRIDAITLGTGAASTNTDIRYLRLSFSSGTFYGGCSYRVFA